MKARAPAVVIALLIARTQSFASSGAMSFLAPGGPATPSSGAMNGMGEGLTRGSCQNRPHSAPRTVGMYRKPVLIQQPAAVEAFMQRPSTPTGGYVRAPSPAMVEQSEQQHGLVRGRSPAAPAVRTPGLIMPGGPSAPHVLRGSFGCTVSFPMTASRKADDLRQRWASQLTKACEVDGWGQIVEAQEGYRKLAVDMAEARGQVAVSSSDQEITRKIILCLSARLETLTASAVRSRHTSMTAADLKSLEPVILSLFLPAAANPYAAPEKFPVSATKYQNASPIIEEGSAKHAVDFTQRDVSDFHQSHAALTEVAGTVVAIRIEGWGLKDAQTYVDPITTVSVVDPEQRIICSVDTHISKERRVNHVLFEERVYLAVSLEEMQRTRSAIFFEFKHYKPKKKKVSTRCWSFMELQEIKPDEETVLEIYHKPTDLRKKKLKLHSVKKLYLHIFISLITRLGVEDSWDLLESGEYALDSILHSFFEVLRLSPAMSGTIRDRDVTGRPRTLSGTAMEAEYFLHESEGPSQGQHEAARQHKESRERFPRENSECDESLLSKDQSYRNGPVRFVVLLFQSLVLMGLTYNYDMCSATRNVLVETLGITDTGYGVISGVYAYPNVILPLFGGLLIDIVGVQRSMIFFVSINFTGTVIYALGLHMRSFTVLVIGRAIFGMGGESLNVSNSTIMTHWFRGKELAFALGSSLTLSRLGSVLVLNTQPVFVRNWGVFSGALAGVCMAGVSVTSAVLTCIIDRQANSYDKAKHITGAEDDTKSGDRGVQLSDVKSFGRMFWCLALSCVVSYMSIFPFYQVVAPAYLQSDAHFGFDLKTTNVYQFHSHNARSGPISLHEHLHRQTRPAPQTHGLGLRLAASDACVTHHFSAVPPLRFCSILFRSHGCIYLFVWRCYLGMHPLHGPSTFGRGGLRAHVCPPELRPGHSSHNTGVPPSGVGRFHMAFRLPSALGCYWFVYISLSQENRQKHTDRPFPALPREVGRATRVLTSLLL
ncbi:hypothetical protein FOZ60_011983 [Perkinsus olseni]|uniref:Lysosomal dipeptide transporter MFSD1 n=2 Tax=Perkinsus olseni TaxID=32597 RepID=A0A7J6NCB5_PEROL|nr:hypothetical protein FOZ60_011983 [Perkinsus olseni]